MNDGWIKIYRQLLQWEWFDKPEMVQIFLYFLLKANQADKVWHGITIRRGQVLTSLATINRDIKMSERTIRTCIKRLKKTNEVTIETTNRYTIVTVCNYDNYQDTVMQGDEQSDKQTDTQATSDRHAADTQATTTKEYKNVRKKEDNTIQEIEGGTATSPADADAPTAPKRKKPEERPVVIPFEKIKTDWNETCKAFPKLHVLSQPRKNKMRNRISEMGGLEKALPLIHSLFEKMQASDFLRGDNKRGWKASFDWLFENDKNWVKVYEGNYDNKPGQYIPTTLNNNTYGTNRQPTQAVQQEQFVRHIVDKISRPDTPEPDISGNY